jgi:hypothetical protein
MQQLKNAGLLVIQNKKLLLAFGINKQVLISARGKIDKNETAIEVDSCSKRRKFY